MEKEALATLSEHIVENLLIEFSAKGNGGESLSLTASEHGRSVRPREIVGFAPDWADFVGLTAIETDTFVENAAAHSLFLYIVIVAAYERLFLLAFLFGNAVDIFLADGVEAVHSPMLVGTAGFGNSVSLVVAFLAHILAEFFVVDFVAIFTLNGASNFLGKFHLSLAVNLDSIVGAFEGVEQIEFRNFVHLTFNHHNIVVSSTYHQIHVGFFKLFKGWVDDEFTIDASNAHFRNRAIERNIAHSESSRSCKTCKGIRHINSITREKNDVYKSIGVIIVGEQRTQHAVNETRCEDFVITCTAFTFSEATGETAECRILFFILYLEWHEVHSLACLFGRNNSSEQHRVAHSQFYCTIGLLRQLTCFKGDSSSVGKSDGFLDRCYHKFFLYI